MLTRTAKDIGYGLHSAGVQIVAAYRRLPVATTIVFAVAVIWIATTGWWNFIRPTQFDLKAYERFQEEVATCRELATSEARYNCVAEAMIGRDQVNFGKSMFVFAPALALLFGYYIWREVRAARREREHAALAERRSRQQIMKMRAELKAEREALATKAANAPDEHAPGPHAILLSDVQPGRRA